MLSFPLPLSVGSVGGRGGGGRESLTRLSVARMGGIRLPSPFPLPLGSVAGIVAVVVEEQGAGDECGELGAGEGVF